MTEVAPRDLPMAWEILDSTELAVGAVSKFIADSVRTPSGDVMARQYLLHPGAVGIIAWDEEADRIAVVRQYRHPVGFQLVEPPAGLLDQPDEAPVLAAQRELAEEAQLAAGRWQVLVDIFTTPGACQESLRIFLARDLRPSARPDGFIAEGEEAHMEVDWVDRSALVSAVLQGSLQNPTMATGILALETARLHGTLCELRPADAPWPARAEWTSRNQVLAGSAATDD